MNLFIKTSFLLCMLLISGEILAQDTISGRRYSVTNNMLMDLAEKYPDKKKSIESKVKKESPQFIDYLKINKDLIQLKWAYDVSLIDVTIYIKNKMYHISHDNKLDSLSNEAQLDTLHIIKNNIKSDGLFCYQLKEKDAMPLTVFVEDSIIKKSLPLYNRINNFPEVSIVTDLNIFPKKYVFGSPKAFVTYTFKMNLEIDQQRLKDVYLAWLNDLSSVEKRKELLEFLKLI